MIRPSPPTNPKPAILTLTHIRRGEGAPSALRSPGNDTWLRWRGTPDASHVFFCHRLPSPLRSGPTVLHRLSLVWPQVRPRDPPPWDTVASCCAPFLLCICRRRSRVSEGGDASVNFGRGSRRRRAHTRCDAPPARPAPPSSRCAPAAQATAAFPLSSPRLR